MMGDYSPTTAVSDLLLQKMHSTKRWVANQTITDHDSPSVASCFSPTAFTEQREPLAVDMCILSPISLLADRLTQHSLDSSTPRRVLAFSDEDDSPNSSGLADAGVVRRSAGQSRFALSAAECSGVLVTGQPADARDRYASTTTLVRETVSCGDYLSDEDGDEIAYVASPAPSSVFEREAECDSRDSGVASNDEPRYGQASVSNFGPIEFTVPKGPAPRKVSTVQNIENNRMVVDDGFDDMDRLVVDREMLGLDPIERAATDNMQRRPPVVNIVKSTPTHRFGLRDVTNSNFDMLQHESPKSSKMPFLNKRKGSMRTSSSGLLNTKPGSIFGHTRKRAKMPSPPASLAATPCVPEGKKRKHSIASSSPMQMETLKVVSHDHPMFVRSFSASVLEGESAEHMELRMQQKEVHYSLPFVSNPQIPSAAFKSIDGETLVTLISQMTPDEFNNKYFLVDCRFPYEYSGGHIKHATNIFEVEQAKATFFPDEDSDGRPQPSLRPSFDSVRRRIPIFYCEFSQKRGPTMAQAVRHHDRARNEHRYPDLDYEEIYVLDRGYRKFFCDDKFEEYCMPRSYVQMREKEHQNQLKFFKKSKSFSGCATGRTGLMARSTKKLAFRPNVASNR